MIGSQVCSVSVVEGPSIERDVKISVLNRKGLWRLAYSEMEVRARGVWLHRRVLT